MRRPSPWLIYLAIVGGLGLLSGISHGGSGDSIVATVLASLPVPNERQLLPDYAMWVITVVGLGYLAYVRARDLRAGRARQVLIRFGTARRFLIREYVVALVHLIIVAVTIVLSSGVGAALSGASTLGDTARFREAIAWLVEASASLMILMSVGWRYPRGMVGLITAIVFVPLGALHLDLRTHLLLFGGLTVSGAAVTALTMRSKDWTER